MRYFIVLMLVGLSSSTLLPRRDFDGLWKRFKERHARKYEGDEETRRRHIWEDHVNLIQEHNLEADLGLHGFTLGINEFADWSREEYKKYLTGFINKKATESEEPSEILLTASPTTLPTEVNWVNRGWVTPVKNQGQCGCCYTFAATGALEGQLFNKTQNLVDLSEQNLIDCSTAQGNMGCNGGVTDWAFKYVMQNGGIDTEQSYPFTGKQGTCQYSGANTAAQCSGWYDIPRGNELALQQAVALVGPVAVAIDASSYKFQLYRSGVYSDSSCSSTDLDHAVLVVGYGVNNGAQYWLVKNSWGTLWGMKGYIQMARNQNNMCGIATQASYPTM